MAAAAEDRGGPGDFEPASLFGDSDAESCPAQPADSAATATAQHARETMDLMRQEPRWVDGRWQRVRLKTMRRGRLHLPERMNGPAARRRIRGRELKGGRR